MKALGIDAGSFTITRTPASGRPDVQAIPSLDGIAAPNLTTSFGFGGAGRAAIRETAN